MLSKLAEFVEREGGHVYVLSVFTGVGIAIWVMTGEKWIAEMFGGALLLAMRGTPKS